MAPNWSKAGDHTSFKGSGRERNSSLEAPRSTMEDKVDRECSMCGDIGFSSELFQCKECNFRWQHSYCSRLYPNMESGNWGEWPVCDWCFGALGTKATLKPKRSASIKLRRSSSSNYEEQVYQAQKGSKEENHHRWDALDYLLEVAHMSSLSDGETSMKRQACSSKRTCARKLSSASSSPSSSFKRPQQKWGFLSERIKLDSSKSSPSSSKPGSPKPICNRRYKFLSDV
ncbi:hypothetical protein SELMODRAFT_406466 [Selaginella moellendorffii]|uniref:PHD-type zinc finger plants domain-containing protein n=2 Tax=Selaginella moellendorffii TaxID=88036 RepID=D8R2G0_SELML|nr:hypothetical protein SELMODRAFT_406466 [Selaginella moellendorffii]